jgi:hypothetical protein
MNTSWLIMDVTPCSTRSIPNFSLASLERISLGKSISHVALVRSSPPLSWRKLSTASFCEVVLAGSDPLLSKNSMRFHLGTQSARMLSTHDKLSSGNRAKLAEFLDAMGGIVSDERRHVLLGQHLLQTVVSIQRGPLYLMCDFDSPFPRLQEVAAVDQLVEPLLEEFEEIDDLEDEDHGIDDDPEFSFEEIDEEHNNTQWLPLFIMEENVTVDSKDCERIRQLLEKMEDYNPQEHLPKACQK